MVKMDSITVLLDGARHADAAAVPHYNVTEARRARPRTGKAAG
jgi:hypothetical protein